LFFQAEDGIRDGHVTGVQTCALPIYFAFLSHLYLSLYQLQEGKIQEALETLNLYEGKDSNIDTLIAVLILQLSQNPEDITWAMKIGRASCRERVYIWEGAE